jgi:hypothetical protein
MRRSALIKKKAARLSETPVLLGENAKPPEPEATRRKDPIVSVRRRGDLLEALEVTCTCGKHMVIEALYDATKAEPAP